MGEILAGPIASERILMSHLTGASNSPHLPPEGSIADERGSVLPRREECDGCHSLFLLREIRFNGRRFLCPACIALEASRQADTASDRRIQS
jgi:hypothetical protein